MKSLLVYHINLIHITIPTVIIIITLKGNLILFICLKQNDNNNF